MAIDGAKKKRLNNVLAGINKKFGASTVDYVSNKEEELTIKRYHSPSYNFDMMLYGGIVVGKVVEFYGKPSSGKTTMAIEIIKENQATNPDFTVGWFETEGSTDVDTLKKFGIDIDRIVYWDQKNVGAEQGFDILRSLVESGEFDMIVINSVAGLCPKAESEDEMGKANIGLTARLMSKLFRVITGACDKNNCTLLFINQVRDNVGVMYGNPETTTGGKALSFYATQRVHFNKVKLEAADGIKDTEGLKISCRTTKNRCANGQNPYQSCTYVARYDAGIDRIAEYPGLLIQLGVLTQAGAWYYEGTGKDDCINKWQGIAKLQESLKNDPVLRERYKKIIYSRMNSYGANALSEEEVQQIKMEEQEINSAININK